MRTIVPILSVLRPHDKLSARTFGTPRPPYASVPRAPRPALERESGPRRPSLAPRPSSLQFQPSRPAACRRPRRGTPHTLLQDGNLDPFRLIDQDQARGRAARMTRRGPETPRGGGGRSCRASFRARSGPMAPEQVCSQCGAKWTGDTPRGLCPACLPTPGQGGEARGPETISTGLNVEAGPGPGGSTDWPETRTGPPGGGESAMREPTIEAEDLQVASQPPGTVCHFGDYELLSEVA